jgi:hypothetical protein
MKGRRLQQVTCFAVVDSSDEMSAADSPVPMTRHVLPAKSLAFWN